MSLAKRFRFRAYTVMSSPGVAGLSAIMIPVLMAYGITH